MLYKIKGRVTGKDGLPVRRKLFCYNRQTGALISETTSDISTGLYELVAYDDAPVMVICQPNSGETLNALVFDNVTPIQVANDTPTGIGDPGGVGFGVGVCANIPTGFVPMEGHTDPYSDNYGNYTYSDGSIMVWIPAFYVKWGNGTNGVPMNQPSVKDKSFFTDEASANAEGYVMHRAFIDGGLVKDGIFVDKYSGSVSVDNTHISSRKNVGPISSTSSNLASWGKPNSGLGLMGAAKLRGNGFSPLTFFVYNALATLSLAHASNSVSTQYCAWYGATKNYPRGVNVNSTANPSLETDSARVYRDSYPGGFYFMRYGSWSVKGISSHNGQESGVQELVGQVEEACFGLIYQDGAYKFLKESFKASDMDFVTGNSIVNGWGNPTSYNAITYTSLPNLPLNQVVYRDSSTTIFPNTTDRNSLSYLMNMCGIPSNGATTINPSNPLLPGAMWNANNNLMIPTCGGHIGGGLQAGIWAFSFGTNYIANTYQLGVRSMFIP